MSLVVGGCTQTPQVTPSSTYRSFDALIDKAIADATDGGASDDQLSDLTEAKKAGQLNLELMREATHRVVDCVAEHGDDIEYGESTNWAGFVLPYYAVTTGSASLDACETSEYFWVSYVYQLQPSRYRAEDALLDGHVEALVSCLDAAGFDTSGMDARDLGDLAEAVHHNAADSPDCLKEAGITPGSV